MTRKPSRSKRQWHPGSRREQGHDDAVAEARLRKAPQIPDHPLITKDDPQLITTDDQLGELVDHLRSVGQFGYDTEFIGEMSYYSRTCVIQVGTPHRVALIDPLEEMDLNPIWELIADPAVEKIVHAGAQDLEPVVRHINKAPANVFDTQIASGFIGRSYPAALAKLVSDLLGVELGKGLTYTSWDRRPMSAVHQHYAADDVRYLPALKDAIDRELVAQGHSEWAAAESVSLCDKARYLPNPQAGFHRIKGATSLAARKQKILCALLTLRDQIAQEKNVPPRSIASDQVLLLLSRQPVSSVDQLEQITSMARATRENYGQAIVDATAQAETLPVEKESRPARQDDTVSQRFAIDALWAMAAGSCHGCGIDPALVTNRQEVADWYRARLNGQSSPNGRLSSGWRAKLLHEPLLAFLDGQTQLRFTWDNNVLRAVVDDISP